MEQNAKQPDSFMMRMKDYESVAQPVLMRRTPVIIRVDGKAFSNLTRKMERPFDRRFIQCMESAAHLLCREVQNVRMAYFQSDEISLLLTDYRTLTTEPWFGNQVQKMCSVAAATATAAFLTKFRHHFPESDAMPVFDARCFNLPREEVVNYFVWRQRDAERNSVSMLASAHFSHNELKGVDRSGKMDLLMLRKGINWNDLEPVMKRGATVMKSIVHLDRGTTYRADDPLVRSKWETDWNCPIFTQNRDYIEHLMREEEVRTS